MSAITSESLLKSIAAMEKQLASMRSALESVAPEAVVVAKKSKKEKKASEEPKEKRAPNAWIVFTSRISALLKANEKSVPVAQQKTFASHLKSTVGETYPEMTDERILEELAGWTCPEPKPRAKKAAETDAASDAGSEKKKRAPMSEEAKAKAAEKRAATKAAKADQANSAETKPAATIVASTPVETVAPPAKKIAKKVVPAAAVKPVSLKFESWLYEGEDCWQNERGDCLNPEGDWMGRFEGGKLNSSVAQPEDLDAAIKELME